MNDPVKIVQGSSALFIVLCVLGKIDISLESNFFCYPVFIVMTNVSCCTRPWSPQTMPSMFANVLCSMFASVLCSMFASVLCLLSLNVLHSLIILYAWVSLFCFSLVIFMHSSSFGPLFSYLGFNFLVYGIT